MTTTEPDRTLTARRPEDLLAAIPVLLGFLPTDSVVMLTLGGAHQFHARVGLPDDPAALPELVDVLVGPARRHRIPGVLLVLYTDDHRRAATVLAALGDALHDAGTVVIDAMRADGDRWWPLRAGDPDPIGAGTAYDVAAHPFAVQAVVDGRITHASREELAASLRERDDELAAEVEAALTRRSAAEPGSATAEAVWVATTVRSHVHDGTLPGPDAVARLVLATRDRVLRDAAWRLMRRATAREHVRLWTHVLRHTPQPLVPAPAALLAFAAWLAGNGALAWCALDRCEEVDPDHTMAALLGSVLTNAVPPSVWEEALGDDEVAQGLA